MQVILKLCSLLLAASLVLSLAGCSKVSTEEYYTDIMTQTVLSDNRIPVTVLVKYAFSINTFEAAAEAKFPNLDIIQVGNYTSNMGTAEYEKRLSNGDLTDIVMTWPLSVGEQYFSDNLIDLSAFPFSNKYNTSMLNSISRDGKLYYLPGPSQVRGIVYNKTLFEENGWGIPSDFDSFLELCKKIEETGIRSLQLGLANPEVLDTAFVGFGYESCYSKPKNAQMIADYNAGNGSFSDNFVPALNTFQTLIDNGILRKEDLAINYADREWMLFERRCAMVEDSVLIARMGYGKTGSTDTFALMPFFNPGDNADWARLYPVCYIGLNKKLTEPANKKKYELVLQLMEYISTPEGQMALSGDTGAMFSSLNGVGAPDIPEINDMLPALYGGRYAIFPTLKNAQSALRDGLKGMVEGKLTAGDVIKRVDAQNLNPPVTPPPAVLGQATDNFSMIETGNFVTDCMLNQGGCEIALFMDNGKDGRFNGKGISGKLYKGDITVNDIRRILPDLKREEKGELWKISMTGENLIKTLEYSIPVDNNKTGWFYYFSGLRVEYSPTAQPGSRVKKITDADGNEIDPNRLYSIAVMDQTVPEEYIDGLAKTGVLISTILEQEVTKRKTISPSNDGRFTVIAP